MKRITFETKVKPVYYKIVDRKSIDDERHRIEILLLFKNKEKLTYDKVREEETRVIESAFTDDKNRKAIENIMKSDKFAVQYLLNDDETLAGLAQIKINYGKEILQWNDKWEI